MPHGTFELLHQLKDELTLLAETDPDKKVRDAAWHTLREAIELNVAEEAKPSRERDREVSPGKPGPQAGRTPPRSIQARTTSGLTVTDPCPTR